ncbi:hypothetical protein MRS44_002748 [Fusarium solani]|uniref:uncharacterized protein n=1 Tax=Fusarium solani TaxID=169388 RepID=UPI0032C467B8|nr:hypothetical protein MRS44_002748 [Fusarium solani]
MKDDTPYLTVKSPSRRKQTKLCRDLGAITRDLELGQGLGSKPNLKLERSQDEAPSVDCDAEEGAATVRRVKPRVRVATSVWT